MKVVQRRWSDEHGWCGAEPDPDAALVLVFGSVDMLARASWLQPLRADHPDAIVFGCSTAGEIVDDGVLDDALVATAISFDATHVAIATAALRWHESASASARALVEQLPLAGLSHVLVLCDGARVNGTELTAGLRAALPRHVAVTGGLSADGERFGTTLVVANEPASEGVVAAIGFYGERLRIGYGSLGGWDPFGPERLITRAHGNVLFELDGQCALELYRSYLGSHADELPAAALRFPLMLRGHPGEPGLVRTILGIDDVAGSMRFAGEMPEGSYARLMKANFERLIDGAQGAAERSLAQLDAPGAELALLISCVGRKLVLRQRVDEEIDSVREVVGPTTTLAGFYSYGEICPVAPDAGCELHNQTMTITTFREL